MPSERDIGRRRRRPKFSIRELLGITCIVALLLGYLQVTSLYRKATARLDTALNSPVLRLGDPTLLTKYRVTSNIAIGGQLLLPISWNELEHPRVRFQLLRASDFSPIAEIPAKVNLVGVGNYSFGGTFKQPIGQPSGLEPGIYIVVVECFDGEELIATQLLSLEAVERSE